MAALLHNRFWTFYAAGYDVLLHLHPYREMMEDIAYALRPSAGEHWLDAGCGTGNLVAALNHGAAQTHIVGMDFSAAMLQRAARKGLTRHLVLGRLDQPLPFDDAVFDAAVCVNVLYALSNPSQTLAEFRRVLKAGGRLALINPKASVSPLRILAAHLRSLASWRAGFAVITITPALIWVGLCNAVVLAGKRRQWFFPSGEELTGLLADVGFADLRVSETYAHQAWLVVGVRE